MLMPNVGATTSTTHIHIELHTDNYPGDYVVHVFDDNDDEVLVAGPWAEYDVQLEPMIISEDHWLQDLGCYRVVLEDMFGDGLYDGYSAFCEVRGIDANGNDMDIILDVQPSVFTEVEGAAEVNEIISVRESEMVEVMEVYPNPTNGMLNIRFATSKSGTTQVQILNVLGEEVLDFSFGNLPAGEHIKQVDLESLSGGVYLLNIINGGEYSTFRVNVN
jgi:hypothetical protein